MTAHRLEHILRRDDVLLDVLPRVAQPVFFDVGVGGEVKDEARPLHRVVEASRIQEVSFDELGLRVDELTKPRR